MRYSIVQHGEQLLAQQRGEAGAPDTTLLATDQQRSVLQTLKADHPAHPIAYSPYGHRTAENGLLSLLGFNGERPDSLTGCYLLGNGHRAFNPVLMRFNSPDSLSPFGKGGLNAYAYCEGEPVLGSDPTGRWKIPNIWKGLKNLFGRTPRKLRTPTPAATQRTADFANTPALRSSPLSAPKDLSMYAQTRSAPGYGRPSTELNTHPNSRAVGRRSSLPNAKTTTINESQYEPVGYHGSLTNNASSLQNGVKQQGRGGKYGDGFYTSVNPDAALSAAPDMADKTAFGVWVKNYAGMTPGRDYITGDWGALTAVAFNVHTYPSIRVDVIRGKFKPVMPRANEAPF
jgi:RHS repeat-associated protein